MNKFKQLAGLFIQFFKFGCFTFGGGWSIVAQMDRVYVTDKKTITGEELIDLTSMARSIPGTMVGNVAMLYGNHEAGILGGYAAAFGLILPPLIFLSVITFFYSVFRHNVWVEAAMTGVRSAVVPIITASAIGLVKGAHKYPPCILVTLLAFTLDLFFDISAIWLVVIGLVCGLIISGIYERKETR